MLFLAGPHLMHVSQRASLTPGQRFTSNCEISDHHQQPHNGEKDIDNYEIQPAWEKTVAVAARCCSQENRWCRKEKIVPHCRSREAEKEMGDGYQIRAETEKPVRVAFISSLVQSVRVV